MAFLYVVAEQKDPVSRAVLDSTLNLLDAFFRDRGLFAAPYKSFERIVSDLRYGHLFSFSKASLSTDTAEARALLNDFLQKEDLLFDVLLLEKIPSLKEPGLLFMDMDKTAVVIEGIDEIARVLGVYDKVSQITSNAMAGHLDFASSLRQRVSLLKSDVSASQTLDKVKQIMGRTPGLDTLFAVVKESSWFTGIASGGFTALICEIDQEYGLDVIKANTLEIVDDKFTGRVVGQIVDAEAKKEALLQALKSFGISRDQSIAIGDGANDIKMIKEAGIGIAYHAKPAVKSAADFFLNHANLSSIGLLLELYAQYGDKPL